MITSFLFSDFLQQCVHQVSMLCMAGQFHTLINNVLKVIPLRSLPL